MYFVAVPVDVVQLVVNQFDRRLAAATPVIALPGGEVAASNASPASSSSRQSTSSSLGQIVIDEGQTLPIECIAVGGNPPPSITVRLGRRDITDLFVTSRNATLLGNQRAMRTVRHYVRSSARGDSQPSSGSQLVVRATDDGLIVRCDATISGLEPVSAGARLAVHCMYTWVKFRRQAGTRSVRAGLRIGPYIELNVSSCEFDKPPICGPDLAERPVDKFYYKCEKTPTPSPIRGSKNVNMRNLDFRLQ